MNNEQLVVGIGASAGGLEAINEFFDNIPNDTGMAFVLVQHLSPDFESLMDALLTKHTKMPIAVVTEETPVKPNHIYLIDKGSNIIIEDNVLKPVERDQYLRPNMPIDEFFHSLGKNCHKNGIGIILSGAGTDGSRGIRTLKESDALILVQSLETASFDGMPKAAIQTGLADDVLAPKEMARTLIKLSTSSSKGYLIPMNYDGAELENMVSKILHILDEKTGMDFMPYRRSTIVRRIEKRMFLNNFDALPDYVKYIKENQEEAAILVQEFLIGVTRFFRDLEAFEIIRNKVIPEIVAGKSENEQIRIGWPAVLLEKRLIHWPSSWRTTWIKKGCAASSKYLRAIWDERSIPKGQPRSFSAHHQ